ncbi:MAG: hypothetical protein R3E68_14540 [Burkholderiaceae bacterium]
MIPSAPAAPRSPDGSMSTVGDVGYVDDDGFLYLTDRSTFASHLGRRRRVYPQECENLLITHPEVLPAFRLVRCGGLRHPQRGPGRGGQGSGPAVCRPTSLPEALAAELIAFCHEHLASVKCPRSIDFSDELPRLPTGKLYKNKLRDPYWAGHKSRLV